MIYLETKLHGNSGQSALINILAAKQTGDILHGKKNRTCEKNRTNDQNQRLLCETETVLWFAT